jgi:tetratricopeptide (TPR) repeat protein
MAERHNQRRLAASRAAATPERTHAGRRVAAAFALLLVALVAIDLFAFAQIVRHEFITLDDAPYVTDNPVVQQGLTWTGVAWAFTTGHAANWHPLAWLSHMLDVELFGMTAAGHHATGLILHVANTLLLFVVLHRLTGAIGRSAFVAALFGVHPLHVESVAWVAELKDVLSTCFWWLTIWAYGAYVRRPAPERYALLLVTFALGLLAKPMLVTVPFVLLLLDVWPLGRAPAFRPARQWLPLVREKWPLFGLAAASAVVTLIAQRQGGAVVVLDQLPVYARVENALLSYAAYLGKAIWPASLSVFYQFPSTIPVERAAAALAVLAGISAVVWRLGGRYPYAAVGWLWYLGTLVPVIGLVQVGSQAMADRYTYVPLVGIFIAVAWGVADAVARWRGLGRWGLPLAATLAVLMLAMTARAQASYWNDDVSLWQHAVSVEPDSAVAHASLGGILARRQRWDEALAQFSVAMQLNPNLCQVRDSLAVAHHERGLAFFKDRKLESAIREFSETIELEPNLASAWNNRGLALAALGRIQEALADFSEAVRVGPDVEVAHLDLGLALREIGRVDEARREFGTVLQLNPRNNGALRALDDIAGRPKIK